MTLFNTPMEELRSRRDNRLQNSDWTQLNDSPLSDSLKTEWRVYRQALRDITSGLDTADKVTAATFPSQPS